MSVSLHDLHGTDAPLDTEIVLKAGPFEAIFEPARAYLRRVRINGTEAVRTVYLHARGADWSTSVPTVSDLETKISNDHFELTWKATHKQGDIDFEWTGTLVGSPDEVYYRCDGVAIKRFATNRTGMCVLIPREYAGSTAQIDHPDGTQSTVHLTRTVAPTEPLRNMHSLHIGPVQLTFEGDVYEAEDQRNWTDSSFKAYSLRGRRAGPYTLEAGEKVMHAVRIAPHQGGGWHYGGSEPGRLPLIGATVAEDNSDLSGLPFDFLRVVIPSDAQTAAHILDHSRASGAAIQVVLGKESATLPLHKGDVVIAGSRPEGAEKVWLSGGYFSEFNQGRREAKGFDGIEVSATPQIHTFDERSILVNAPTLEDAVLSLNALVPGAPTSFDMHLSADGPDSRLHSMFGALWVLASITALSRGGATSVSFGNVNELRTPTLLALFHELRGGVPTGRTTLDNPAELTGLTVERDGKFFVVAGNLLRAPRAVSLDTQVLSARRLTPKGWEIFTYDPGQVFGPYEIMSLEVTFGTLKLS